MGRNAEIQKETVHGNDAQLGEYVGCFSKTGTHGAKTGRKHGQLGGGVRNRLGVLIQSEHAGAGLQKKFRMAAAAERTIDELRAGRGRERFQNFLRQHGGMILAGSSFQSGERRFHKRELQSEVAPQPLESGQSRRLRCGPSRWTPESEIVVGTHQHDIPL